MKRIPTVVLAALAGIAVFALLVYALLLISHLSERAATTVQGLTPRRLWATSAAALALFGVVVGGLTLARDRTVRGSRKAALAAGVGLIAALNGGLNLAVANGGPGTGNGVVGGSAAVVLGAIAMTLGALSLARRRAAMGAGRTA